MRSVPDLKIVNVVIVIILIVYNLTIMLVCELFMPWTNCTLHCPYLAGQFVPWINKVQGVSSFFGTK